MRRCVYNHKKEEANGRLFRFALDSQSILVGLLVYSRWTLSLLMLDY
jgi:hypothetical protein